MDALPVHQVMSYHSPGAAGSYKGQRTICLQASMPFWCMQTHTHTHVLLFTATITYLGIYLFIF